MPITLENKIAIVRLAAAKLVERAKWNDKLHVTNHGQARSYFLCKRIEDAIDDLYARDQLDPSFVPADVGLFKYELLDFARDEGHGVLPDWWNDEPLKYYNERFEMLTDFQDSLCAQWDKQNA